MHSMVKMNVYSRVSKDGSLFNINYANFIYNTKIP